MWATVEGLTPWQQVVSSPMLRCLPFAQAVAEKYSLPLAVDERLKEIGLGAWEGKTPGEIRERSIAEYEAYYKDAARNRPRGAEPLESFCARVNEALDDILNRYRGKHVLVVGHAGVVRAVVGHLLQADPSAWYRISVDYAAATRICDERYGRVLEFHNRRSFF